MPFDLTTTLGTLQKVATVVRKAGQIELTNQVHALQESMGGLIAERNAQIEEIKRLKDENADLRRQLGTREALTFENNAYWAGAERTESSGPYCAPCFDSTGKLIRMLRDANYVAKCQTCKTRIVYDPARYKKPSPVRSRGVSWINDF